MSKKIKITPRSQRVNVKDKPIKLNRNFSAEKLARLSETSKSVFTYRG